MDEREEMTRADAEALLAALGIPVPAGGKGEAGGEAEGPEDETDGQESAGEDRPGESGDEAAEGEETEEAEEGEEEAGEEGGEARGERRSRFVPYERFQEVNDRLRQTEETMQILLRGGRNGQDTGQRGFQVPEQYKELDSNFGPYLRAYLDPLAAATYGWRNQLTDQLAGLADETKFYRRHRDLTPEQSDLVERTQAALNEKLGKPGQPVQREDVLLYLRGHPKYGKQFVAPEQQRERLAAAEVAARRKAGKLGGKAPIRKVGKGQETPDLKAMTPAQRIKHFETELAEQPF